MRLASVKKSVGASFVFVFAAGCGSSPPPRAIAKAPETPQKQPDLPKVAVCNDQVDVADLFARHAANFGSEAAVAEALPITITGAVTVSGKTGTFERSFSTKQMREAVHLKGFERAMGTDDGGAWVLGNSGAVSRLRPDETRATEAWIITRKYLSAFDPKRDRAVCHLEGGKREIIVHEKIDELGSPRLVFDQESAELIGAEYHDVDGQDATRTFAWKNTANAGVRWPAQTSAQDGDGATIDESYDVIAAAKDDAFALPTSMLAFTWPKSGTVRVPMQSSDGEIFFDVVVGGKKARALLDSGLGISIVEASGKAANAFTTELEFGGQGATQKISFGVGEIDEARIGALVVKKIPAARVPIPMLEKFGSNKPDVVLGWSLFEGNVVRIDYARKELIFSRDPSSQHPADATSIDLHVWNDKLVTFAKIEGRPAPIAFQIASGKPFALSVSSTWAKQNHFDTPSLASAYTIGPITSASDPIELYDLPDSGADVGIVAGMIGGGALARCTAITFDVPNRKMWLEGACGRTPTAR
jgi:hypothetical protein